MLRAVIMAGGSGTRFWPRSRHGLPKQFLRFHGDRSLLQQAFDRIIDFVGADGVWVVTSALHRDKTCEQLPALRTEHVIGEPCGRDTAACIGLAAAVLRREDPQARMIVLAADHLIEPTDSFHRAVRAAEELVQQRPEALVTFGIPPTRPATGYGYLRRGQPAVPNDSTPVYKLDSFHEKPSLERAREYLANGEFYWNSGIFCWRAETILEELRIRTPTLLDAVERIADAWNSPQRDKQFATEFATLPKISIDYAVMEHSQNVYMVEAPFRWDDVGSWLALERVFPSDAEGNVVLGQHRGIETRHCIIVGDESRLVATIGVSDLVVVHTSDVTFVAHRSQEQAIKELLARLEADSLGKFL